jgi:hypothetical protein
LSGKTKMTNIQEVDTNAHRYVFICGLHRSGTSVLGRNITKLENCTGFNDTGAIEDEGQFLQDVYPTSKAYGGAGRFGFDPRAHLTEDSPLLTLENALKLRQNWERYWDPSKTIRVEKTPGNLLKTRFLQAVFPDSYFIVVRRHPVAVSMANQRWKVSFAPLHNLFDHWLHCYGLFEQDKKYLKHVYELTYEDYIQNPERNHQEVARFIGAQLAGSAMEAVTDAYNQKYFNRWSDLLNDSPFKGYYRYIASKYEPKFNKYGYSLTEGFGLKEERLREVEPISATTGALYCLAADAYSLMVRSSIQAKAYIKRQLREHLPEPLKVRIKHVLRKTAPMKKQRKMIVS